MVISKSGKSHIEIVMFEVENLKLKLCVQILELTLKSLKLNIFEHLCLELIKNNIDENNIALKMSAFKHQISICSFFVQKSRALDGWMDGWVNVGAGLRLAHTIKN